MSWSSNNQLSAGDEGPVYPVLDGVACLLPDSGDRPNDSIRQFYQRGGWDTDKTGMFADTKAFVDTRPASLRYTRRCIKHIGRHFAGSGQYILDAGSGPIPHDELLDYGEHFERRVCVDLSAQALSAAQRKLGSRGIYVQGDMTSLPLANCSMDAITCNHVIYQIPAELQARAFLELWQVLKPGGVAVIVYWWPDSPLDWRLKPLAKAVCGNVEEPITSDDAPELYHHPHSRSWFESQEWPFRHRYDTFRIVDNAFMRTHVSGDWRGSVFLNMLYAMQTLAPEFCGKHGRIPAIVIRKD